MPLPPGNDAERDLRLRQDGAAERREAHVERQHELAAAAARAALELGDRRLRHRPEAIDHGVEEPELARLRWDVARQPLDQRDVGMRDEEVRVGAVEHHDPHVGVDLELAPEAVHLLDERQVEEVDRRMIDGDEDDATLAADSEALVSFVGHDVTSATKVTGVLASRSSGVHSTTTLLAAVIRTIVRMRP